jgi:hypothetical protein
MLFANSSGNVFGSARPGLEVLRSSLRVWKARGDPDPEEWVKARELARMGGLDY